MRAKGNQRLIPLLKYKNMWDILNVEYISFFNFSKENVYNFNNLHGNMGCQHSHPPPPHCAKYIMVNIFIFPVPENHLLCNLQVHYTAHTKHFTGTILKRCLFF